MSTHDTIRILLMSGARGAEPLDPAETPVLSLSKEKRTAARVAWVRETMAKLRAAQERLDKAWMLLVKDIPDDVDDDELPDIPPPPEQAEFDAIYAELRAVADHGRGPRHLHFSGI